MTKRDLWIQIGEEALSAADRFLIEEDAAKFKTKLKKLLVAVRDRRLDAITIEKFLVETPDLRNWARRRATRAAAVETPQRTRLKGGASRKRRPAFRSPDATDQELRKRTWHVGGWNLFEGADGSPLGTEASFEVARQPDVGVGSTKKKATNKSKAKMKHGKGAEAKKKAAFTAVRVYFGTDRKPTGSQVPKRCFGAERGELSLGFVEVSIPHDHRMGKLEAPPRWKWFSRDDPRRYILLLDLSLLTREEFTESFRENLQPLSTKDALVFVHGYNISFADACRRTAQIAYDLNFKGLSVAYSWPSQGRRRQYLIDETNVKWSVPHFQSFLSLILSDTGAEAVHVIAHSMGNRALVEALRAFDLSKLPEGSARLNQVIFAAPDIDADTFRDMAEEFRQKATRFTLYASSKDKALILSKKAHGYPRAGDSGEHLVLLDGLDTVDATEVATGFLQHSYIGDNDSILADVYDLLRGTPPPRFRLRRRERDGRAYWMFQP